MNYKMNEPIPYLPYTKDENGVWGVVYQKLRAVQKEMACKEFNDAFDEFEN